MKKITQFLLVLLLAGTATTTARAQELLTKGPLNEVKVNIPMTIAGSAEIGYERILMEDLSVGVAGSYGWDEDFPYRYAVQPYARWFFWKHRGQDTFPGAGFFIEVNGAILGVNTLEERVPDPVEEVKTGAGLGLAVGWKWISHNGFVGEVFTGGGRNFVSSTSDDLGGYFRLGVSLGYRF
jgi:hypothetical protein